MQQVNQIGFRVGSALGWTTSRHQKGNVDVSWRYVDATRKALAKRGLFCINNYVYNHRGMTTHNVVFYRYLQRSKLNRGIVHSLNQREGSLAPLPVRYHAIYKLDIASMKSTFARKLSLLGAFPAMVEQQKKRKGVDRRVGRKGSQAKRDVYNAQFKQQKKHKLPKLSLMSSKHVYAAQREMKAKKDIKLRGWMDLEGKLYDLYKLGETELMGKQLRLIYDQMFGGRSNVLLYNIMQFIPMLNPLATAKYYIFKRFGGLIYQADIVQATYLATHFNMSRLLSHTIVLGLERHAGERKQRRFLKMLEATIARLTSGDELELTPFVCRISVGGKLDAKMRRTHVLLETGEVQYQQVNFMTSANKHVSKSKFGTSSVQIGLRNVSEMNKHYDSNES